MTGLLALVGVTLVQAVQGTVMYVVGVVEVSVTCEPPSCAAIEPQKFSAATTEIFVLEPGVPVAAAGAVVEQPASTATATPAAAPPATVRLVTARIPYPSNRR